jgi:alpha-L-fucosidase
VMLTPHHWFMGPPSKPRTLESLIETYHASVGSNCVLELGMAVDHTGVVPADQVQLATQFGTWVKACYGSPVVLWTATDSGGGSAVTLTLQRPTTIDRVSIGEDLSFGQLIRMYKISVRESAGVAWRPFSEGTGVGNKKIDISAKPMVVQALLLNVTQAVGVPHIKRFAAFAPCAS